jgi:hypothetical protein
MDKRWVALAVVTIGLLGAGAAHAQTASAMSSPAWWPFPGPVKHAPAPLLAAGIPALLGVGGGAGVTALVRRFRPKNKRA